MVREMTQQERAAVQYTMNDLFRMAMDGKVNIVEDKFVYASALQQTRRAALLEVAQQARFGAMELRAINEPLQTDALGYGQKALQDFADILDRLASEGG